MSRQSALLAALTDEPVSTSDLYERMGYPTLVALGLVGYPAFRDELGKLAGAGLIACETAHSGATVWWLVPEDGDDSPAGVDSEG